MISLLRSYAFRQSEKKTIHTVGIHNVVNRSCCKYPQKQRRSADLLEDNQLSFMKTVSRQKISLQLIFFVYFRHLLFFFHTLQLWFSMEEDFCISVHLLGIFLVIFAFWFKVHCYFNLLIIIC